MSAIENTNDVTVGTENVVLPIEECPSEDSWNCFWNAPTRGNGEGQSFFVDAEGHYQDILGCAPDTGLPLMGVDQDGMWAMIKCDPALGNYCGEGTKMAEDFSCVPSDYWGVGEQPATGDEGQALPPVTIDPTPAEPITVQEVQVEAAKPGPIVPKPEVTEVVSMSGAPVELANTGADDVQPGSLALAIMLIVVGIWVSIAAYRKRTYRPKVALPTPSGSKMIRLEPGLGGRGVRFVEDTMSLSEETYRRYAGKFEQGYTVR